MKCGDIILVPFPFSELTNIKVRPAVVISTTLDKFHDIIVSAISSVIPKRLSQNEILVSPNESNGLRAISVIKVDRIVTLKKENIIAHLGELSDTEVKILKVKFRKLV